METLFNQFMHIYFWVFLIAVTLGAIDITLNEYEKTKLKVSFWSLVGLVLFIMSFKY